jgi:hypothetical protein
MLPLYYFVLDAVIKIDLLAIIIVAQEDVIVVQEASSNFIVVNLYSLMVMVAILFLIQSIPLVLHLQHHEEEAIHLPSLLVELDTEAFMVAMDLAIPQVLNLLHHEEEAIRLPNLLVLVDTEHF